MSSSVIVNIVIGVAVVALLIVRQMRTRPVRETSAVRLVLILGVIGVIETIDTARNHHVNATGAAVIVFGLLLGAVLGAWRAVTVRVWRQADGSAWRQGTVATAVLWIVAIATHIAVDLVVDRTDKSAAAVASASILLYLAVSLGVQREVLRARAARLQLG